MEKHKSNNLYTHQNIEIKCDNMCIIDSLDGSWSYPWKIEILISDSRMNLLKFSSIQIRHIFKKVNSVADKLTHLQHLTSNATLSNDVESQVLIRKNAL